MSAEGWILLVGLRVVDLGLLAAWLFWFFRLRGSDEDDFPDEEGPGGGDGPDRRPGGRGPRGPGLALPQARRRIRGHSARSRPRPRRGDRPSPAPLPARVRRPRSPVPARRTAGPARRSRLGLGA